MGSGIPFESDVGLSSHGAAADGIFTVTALLRRNSRPPKVLSSRVPGRPGWPAAPRAILSARAATFTECPRRRRPGHDDDGGDIAAANSGPEDIRQATAR